MAWPLAMAALLGTAIAACMAGGSPCPCGEAYRDDPFSSQPLEIGVEHDATVHCYCRCGDDEPLRMPPSETCSGYEGPCGSPDGTIARLSCD
jgi:hypothetical protein